METISQEMNVMIDLKQLETNKDPFTKLPYQDNWFKNFGRIDIPLCDPEIIKNIINKVIFKIEGVRGTYNELSCCWELEYGTKPIEYTINNDYKLRQIIKTKKWAALMTANKAFQMFPGNFPGNFPDNDTELSGPIGLLDNPKWAEIEIRLSYDKDKKTIVIEPNRLCGDHAAFHYINRALTCVLKDESLINWLKRVNYLMFVYGIEYDSRNPILKFLCDEYMMREICCYL
jgi:hypothetical protein